MKSYITGLLVGGLLCPVIMAQVTSGTSGLDTRPAIGTDIELRDKLVGDWSLSVTNPIRGDVSGQWMATTTEYRRDGTFDMRGQIGTMVPSETTRTRTVVMRDGKKVLRESSTSPANGSGVWRIDHGLLYSTFTTGNWATNVEACYEIQSLTDKLFTYRKKAGDEKGLVLQAIRK